MCLAIPAKIIEIKDNHHGIAETDGLRKEISLDFTPEAKIGDYVIVHVGHALSIIDPKEAKKNTKTLRRNQMKYMQEFQDKELVQRTAAQIKKEVQSEKFYNFMEFCGGHTHVLFRQGLHDLLPKNIKMVHGPGCPVCVLATSRIDASIQVLKNNKNVIMCTYSDLMNIPGSNKTSLMKTKAMGYQIKMVYSPLDALKIAKENPSKSVIFFAIGFETTTPPTAATILKAKKYGVKNFSVYCNHVMTPPAVELVLNSSDVKLDGFIGPGHVSTIIGSKPFEYFTKKYNKPVIVSGFMPLDIIQSILLLVRQVNEGKSYVHNQYTRSVKEHGNEEAKKLINEVLDIRTSFEWRGLGSIPYSAYKVRDKYKEFDAEKIFNFQHEEGRDNPACLCGSVLRGINNPLDCKLFGKVCVPDNPKGPCMVSSEGACAAYYSYEKNSKIKKE